MEGEEAEVSVPDLPTLPGLVPSPGRETVCGPQVSLLPSSSMMGRSSEEK